MKNVKGIALGALGFSLLAYFKKEPVACVQLAKVYQEFELKKELEAKFTNVTAARKKAVDSLELQLKVLSNNINQLPENDKLRLSKIEQFEYKREEYFAMKKKMEEDNASVSKMYEEQIWTQLNQYIADYGKEQGLSCILGANGTGTLMYSAEKIDITAEIVKIVNERYKGSAK